MASAEQQIEFLRNLQRLLAGGSFVSTYKYALLLSLADLSVELGNDQDEPLQIPTRHIGEKFIELYWRQCAPYFPAAPTDDGLLRQNTGDSPRVIKLLLNQRAAHQSSLPQLRADTVAWEKTVAKVADQVRKMPLWKLQTVPGEKLDFLYVRGEEPGTIILKPTVAFCFRKHYQLVLDLVTGAWAQYVRRHNANRLQEKTDLHEFLFGSNRSDLTAVRSIVRPFQLGKCFYCGGLLGDEPGHVDHFVPWARYPVDLGHNFVLAHASCNEKKSDPRLVMILRTIAGDRPSRLSVSLNAVTTLAVRLASLVRPMNGAMCRSRC